MFKCERQAEPETWHLTFLGTAGKQAMFGNKVQDFPNLKNENE